MNISIGSADKITIGSTTIFNARNVNITLPETIKTVKSTPKPSFYPSACSLDKELPFPRKINKSKSKQDELLEKQLDDELDEYMMSEPKIEQNTPLQKYDESDLNLDEI